MRFVLVAALLPFIGAVTASTQDAFALPDFSLATVLARAQATLSHDLLAELTSHIESLPERRLVRLGEGQRALEVTEGQKALLTWAGRKFVDVTDEQELVMARSEKPFPTKLAYKASKLEPLFSQLSVPRMTAFLRKFSGFKTRYYRSTTGRESQLFLLGEIKSIIKANSKLNVTVKEFEHPWSGQQSILVRFEKAPAKVVKGGQGRWRMDDAAESDDSIVVIGAHQDSTNLLPFLPAPGADDDGSGTTTILEAFRVLANATYAPTLHPVEFHWYSAEEGGLLGSQGVAQAYAAAGHSVRGMLQLDMTAWIKAGTTESIGIITDFVDDGMVKLLKKVVGEYAEIPSIDTKCGYACSDHASWSKVGAPSTFAIESTFEDSNHGIHSGSDTMDHPEFSVEHMKQFSRTVIGLVAELAGGF